MNPVTFPPLNTLRAFESAARLGSFAAAAGELNLTSAAISHRIKELEGRINVPLFVRLPRGVRLTPEGRLYYERLASVFTQIEQATRDLKQPSAEGPLVLSAPHSFIQYWLAPRLSRLYARHPGLQLTCRANSELLSFRENQADIGIRFGAGRYSGLHSELLMSETITVLAPTALLGRLTDTRPAAVLGSQLLLEDDSVLPSEPWSFWQTWFQEAGIELTISHPRVRFSDSSLALTACADNLGLSIGRRSLASQLLIDNKVTPIMPWRSHEFAYYLVCSPPEVDNPRLLVFRQWLLEEIDLYENSLVQERSVRD